MKQEELYRVEIDDETFDIPCRYELAEWMGEGSYGVVFSAIDLSQTDSDSKDKFVAIKKNRGIFPKGVNVNTSDNGSPIKVVKKHLKGAPNGDNKKRKINHCNLLSQKRILREFKVLAHLRGHPNIINLYDVILPTSYESFSDVYFVMDLMEADLRAILDSDQQLTNQHVQYLMYQLLLGVYYYQSANVMHRDLKPENILVNANCELKICDFGLARMFDVNDPRMSTNYIQTRWYRAPELLLDNATVSKSTDMWSVGCIMAELLGRRVMFRGSSSLDQLRRIIYIMGTPDTSDIRGCQEGVNYVLEMPYCRPKDLSSFIPDAAPAAIDLLKKLLIFNYEKRITPEEALRHEYFSTIFAECDMKPCAKEFDFSYDEGVEQMEGLKRKMYEGILEFKEMISPKEVPRPVADSHSTNKCTSDAASELVEQLSL